MKESKPREFWIYDNGEYFGSQIWEEAPDEFDLKDFRRPQDIVHVIERSAYDAVKEQRDDYLETMNIEMKEADKARSERDQAIELLREATAVIRTAKMTFYAENEPERGETWDILRDMLTKIRESGLLGEK